MVMEENVGCDLVMVADVVDEGRQRVEMGEGVEWGDPGMLES